MKGLRYIDIKVSYNNVVLVCRFLWLSYKEQRFLPVFSNDVLKFGGTTRMFGKENLQRYSSMVELKSTFSKKGISYKVNQIKIQGTSTPITTACAQAKRFLTRFKMFFSLFSSSWIG